MQVGTVFAAPATQDGTISGEIVSVEPSTPDANGDPTYLVTVNDGTGEQTVRISYDTAVDLGLFVIDPNTNEPALDPITGNPLLDPDKVGTLIEIPQDAIIPDEEPEEGDVHPISQILADFFNMDAGVIDQYHDDGFGFGVIAQALWMSQGLTESDEGDPALTGCILDAKKNGTYGDCFDFGDEPVPTNWGQFKKMLKEDKDKHNLGVIVSGHAHNSDDENTDQEHGNGNGNGNGHGNGNGNGNGHGNGNGNGNGHGNGNGN
jgi:hypothetical protein